MNKIICDVCGTSYADNAAQCPICGYVNPIMAENSLHENIEGGENGDYTYTKGGRFSKSNVRKRIKNNPIEEIDEYAAPEEYEEEEEHGNQTPLVVVAVILLLAIAAVVLFITMRYFGGDAIDATATDSERTTQQTTVAETTDDGVLECVKLEVSETEISIPAGGTYQISVIKEPVDTTDELLFESADPEIATVDASGVVTPVKTGTTKIIVTCGQQKLEITVSCEVTEETPFMLTRMELTFAAVGETWELYVGEIPADEISFSSDDEAVAVIDEKGVVTAIGEGQTSIHAVYGETTVSCTVICNFSEETSKEDSSVTEDGGMTEDGAQTGELLTEAPKATGTKGYKIKTNFGEAYVSRTNPALFDVGHYIDYDITLRLVDENGNRIPATWTVYNTSICKQKTAGGSEFACLAEGKAFAVATTDDGETYVCIIRVSPYPG